MAPGAGGRRLEGNIPPLQDGAPVGGMIVHQGGGGRQATQLSPEEQRQETFPLCANQVPVN